MEKLFTDILCIILNFMDSNPVWVIMVGLFGLMLSDVWSNFKNNKEEFVEEEVCE